MQDLGVSGITSEQHNKVTYVYYYNTYSPSHSLLVLPPHLYTPQHAPSPNLPPERLNGDLEVSP